MKIVADDDRKALEWFIAYVSHEAVKSELNKQYVNISVGLLLVYLLFHFGTLSLPASLTRFLTPFNFLPLCSLLLSLSASLPQFIVLSSERSQSSAVSLKHWVACACAMALHTLSMVYVVWVDGGANDSLM